MCIQYFIPVTNSIPFFVNNFTDMLMSKVDRFWKRIVYGILIKRFLIGYLSVSYLPGNIRKYRETIAPFNQF